MYTLARNANVKVNHVIDDKKKNVVEIVVNDQFHHRFPSTSRVSKHLDVMTPVELEQRMNGGQYFFIGDQMVDFRGADYDGFVHSDSSIDKFMDILGFENRAAQRFAHTRKRSGSESNSDILLRKSWSKNEINVPGYQQGGEFHSELSFLWNPFVKTIDSSFDLVRLICTNGMVGKTSFLNTKIPLVNRFEEHLEIANRQIQNKVNHIVSNRIQNMSTERATLGDCLTLQSHVSERLQSTPEDRAASETQRLMNLLTAVSPKRHLSHVYTDSVFDNKNLASQLPAHLSTFDVYNIATELRSHTSQTGKSSDAALDRISNELLFDRDGSKAVGQSKFAAPRLSPFSSAERAFFGEVEIA